MLFLEFFTFFVSFVLSLPPVGSDHGVLGRRSGLKLQTGKTEIVSYTKVGKYITF